MNQFLTKIIWKKDYVRSLHVVFQIRTKKVRKKIVWFSKCIQKVSANWSLRNTFVWCVGHEKGVPVKAVAVEVAVAEMVEVEVRRRKSLAFLCDSLASLLDSASTAIFFTELLKKNAIGQKNLRRYSRYQPRC